MHKLRADDSVHPSTTVSTNDSSFFHEITHTTSFHLAFHDHRFMLINRSSIQDTKGVPKFTQDLNFPPFKLLATLKRNSLTAESLRLVKMENTLYDIIIVSSLLNDILKIIF